MNIEFIMLRDQAGIEALLIVVTDILAKTLFVVVSHFYRQLECMEGQDHIANSIQQSSP